MGVLRLSKGCRLCDYYTMCTPEMSIKDKDCVRHYGSLRISIRSFSGFSMVIEQANLEGSHMAMFLDNCDYVRYI